ncbi:MAG: T9SS type A sorting domain-containing protein [Tannerellaceae bacterium]|jgi:hypothetical protein|nr:T9SS type A sorting domain-containing protein [Tannerellaceae bacterium]
MKKIAILTVLLSAGVVHAQLGKPFTIGDIQSRIAGNSLNVSSADLAVEDVFDVFLDFPGVFTIDGLQLQKVDYKERRAPHSGDGGYSATRVFRAVDGRTDTLRRVWKAGIDDEYVYNGSDRTIYRYSEDDKILSCMKYYNSEVHDSLGAYEEFDFEYDALGRVSSWKVSTYVMLQDWASFFGEDFLFPVGGYPDIVEGLPIWRGLRKSVQTVYDYEANLIAVSREGFADNGQPAWNDTIRLRPTEDGHIAEKKQYDPGSSTPFFPTAWLKEGAKIRYILDDKGRLLHVMDEYTGEGIAYTYLEDGYEMEMTFERNLTGDGSEKAICRFYPNGYVSEILYQTQRVSTGNKYEYIGFNNPPNEVSPIPLPASNEWALSVVEGGLRLSLTAPTDVEVFQPTGRLVLSRQLSGDTILSLPSGVYLVRIGGQTTRRIVIR